MIKKSLYNHEQHNDLKPIFSFIRARILESGYIEWYKQSEMPVMIPFSHQVLIYCENELGDFDGAQLDLYFD